MQSIPGGNTTGNLDELTRPSQPCPWRYGDRFRAMTQLASNFWMPRQCFSKPIPAAFTAANLLSKAVDAVRAGEMNLAKRWILQADMIELWDYMQRISGPSSSEIHRFRIVPGAPPQSKSREKLRMPSASLEFSIFERDGWHCRFCGCPVVAKPARKKLGVLFPDVARWGRINTQKHFGLAALESTLDHLLPHSRGGDNGPANLITACGPCQFGRGSWTLDEVGLENPLEREPIRNSWDGLTRLLAGPLI